MKCPVCESAGERSTVQVHGWVTTAMATHSFYDEDGQYHHHDRNWSGATWRCSSGHVGGIHEKPGCPAAGCEFTNERKVTVDDSNTGRSQDEA